MKKYEANQVIKAIETASRFESEAKTIYFEAFVSASFHVAESGNIALLSNGIKSVNNKSIYKKLIVRWLCDHLNIIYDKESESFRFKRKGKALKFTKKQVENLIKTPFWEKKETEDTESNDLNKSLKGILSATKRMEKLVVEFEDIDSLLVSDFVNKLEELKALEEQLKELVEPEDQQEAA